MNLRIAPSPICRMFYGKPKRLLSGYEAVFQPGSVSRSGFFIGMVCSASGTTIPLPLPPVGVGVGWSGFEYENAQESTR